MMATAHFLAVVSPGPDFAVVTRHAITWGRRCAMYTSVGVGCAILLHISYTLLGLGLMLSQTPWMFDVLKYVAAAYLCYIGYGALKSAPPAAIDESIEQNQILTVTPATTLSDWRSFTIGFMTNGLNPKATLFFLALFSVIVSPQTPTAVKVGYGFYMAFATSLWFCFLSAILTFANVRRTLLVKGYWIERCMGVILILLAIKLVFSSI